VPLQFNLLGSLNIESDGEPSEILKSPKGCALVSYLIVTGQTHTREFLADLLWEASSTSQALRNLRALLIRIRNLVPELQITRTSLVFQPLPETSVDFLRLQAALEGDAAQIDDSQLDTALQLYRGDLLENFYLDGAPRFEEWLALERERLRQKVQAAFQRLCKTYLEMEQWANGLALAQRWLTLDPLNEEAVRACMQILATQGEPGGGLQQYEGFRQQLWGHFELDPEPATVALAARLRHLLEEQGQRMAWEHISAPGLPEPGELPNPGPLPPNSILPYTRNPDFTGRQADLLALADSLFSQEETSTPPTAAITGMGGLGKTQLAIEFAYRYGRYFPGGVYWMRFADPENVPFEIATTGGERGLGLYHDAENLSLTDQVGRVQRAWQEPVPRLLIFDNCESQALLDQWRPVTGGCRVLITSRRTRWSRELQVTERLIRVLAPAESATILRQLAPQLSEAEAGEIATELGHLPLALQLAGEFLGRYRQFDAERYLAQFRETGPIRHPSLAGRGARYSPTGHELNVSRTFALSLEQLDPADEADNIALGLLERAACFAPSMPIPSRLLLGTILSDEGDLEAVLQVEDGLARLVTLGFLQREGSETVVIHRLVAAFANELSATNEAGITAVGNMLVKVLSRSLDQQGHLGQLPIAAYHLSHVTNMALSAKAPVALHLSTLFAHHLRDVADYEGARDVLQRVLAVPGLTDDPQELAEAWAGLARVQRSLGQDRESLNSAEQAERLVRTADVFSPNLLAYILHRKGWSLFMLGRAEEAIAAAEEALALSQKANSNQEMISNLNLLGEVHSYLLEQYEKAVQYNDEALKLAREMGNLRAEAALLSNLGELFERQGDFERALQLYQNAINLSKETGNKDKEIYYRANLGRAQVYLGKYDQAVDCLEELLNMLPQKTHLISEVQLSLAGAYLGQGRLDLAVAAGQGALTQAGSDNPFVMGQAWAMLGRIAARMGATVRPDPNEDAIYDAQDCFKQSLEVFSKSQSRWGRASVLWHWAEAEFLQGDPELGEKMWREGRDIFAGLNLPLMVARMEADISKK
jgi:DNA-binding SARP family transcriptional activator